MAEEPIKFEVVMNPKNIQSIGAFVNLKGRCLSYHKDGYFLRHIGCENQETFLRELERMDTVLGLEPENNQKNQSGYMRVLGFSKAMTKQDSQRLAEIYDMWLCLNSEKRQVFALTFSFQNTLWDSRCKNAFEEVLSLFTALSHKNTPTIVRNFGVKLLYWLEYYLPKLFLNTKILHNFPKLVYCGNIKEQEYLFLHFLVQLGCDVLYINPLEDIAFSGSNDTLLSYSKVTKHSNLVAIAIPEFGVKTFTPPPKIHTVSPPQRPLRPTAIAASFTQPQQNQEQYQGEKDYESLAGLATAVVMISAYNEKEECIQTGSGVIINRNGYILTNFHVVQGGHYFGVRMEEVDEIFYTSELIKYHNLNDLALLKIEYEHEPIPIFQGAKALVRGQRVIAIGSPLGLFNSVSDGMISGFRTVRDIPMIQFTAPISNGSSGGALLDLHGRLIGIITAGFDNGQNLNLALDYETMLGFVRGFIS